MLYAVVSDIHANYEALKVVLDDIEARRPDRKICLGDIIGYNAAPSECLELVRHFDVILMGNHDYAISDPHLVEKFNFHARLAIEWTMARLSPEEKQAIARLPYLHKEGDTTFVHATPRHPEQWGYIMNIDDAMDAFNYYDTPICFVGHTHYPVVVSDSGEIIMEKRMELKRKARYVVNVGSVGQPRDADNRACYVLYDSDKHTVEYVRLPYDIEATQRRMMRARFPQFLINRLSEGR